MRTPRRLLAPVLLAVAALVVVACGSTPVERAEETQSQASESFESAPPPATDDAHDAAEETEQEAQQDAEPAPAVVTPTPGAARASSATNTGAGSTAASRDRADAADIRSVDFENGFTYQLAAFDDTPAVVADGEFVNGELGDEQYFWFAVNDVQYGDLNDDGVEEAVVVTGYSGGGSGFFQSVRAFGLVDGAVTDLGEVPFGDRAFGGVADVIVDAGVVSVLTFVNGEGSCCATEAAIVRLVLGQHFLAQADTETALTHISLSQFEEQRLVKFLPGTSGAYASMWGDDLDGSFSFEAGPGQVLTVQVLDGPAPSTVTIVDTSTGERVGTGASAVLPSDAIYEIDVVFDGERADTTTLLVQIDDEPEAISWVPTAEQILVTADPFVRSSLTWPTFSSTTAASSSLDAANAALATFAVSTDDLWIDYAQEFPTPLDDSSYELTYEVSYAADDLVAVRFSYYDYICCSPHPNYGPLAAVLDLRDGRLIEASEILDFERADEIEVLWLAALASQGLLDGELLSSLDLSAVNFEAVGLVPEGIELGTGRAALGGGTPGTSVVLSFDELGDLVQPSFRERLASS